MSGGVTLHMRFCGRVDDVLHCIHTCNQHNLHNQWKTMDVVYSAFNFLHIKTLIIYEQRRTS